MLDKKFLLICIVLINTYRVYCSHQYLSIVLFSSIPIDFSKKNVHSNDHKSPTTLENRPYKCWYFEKYQRYRDV